MNKIITSLKIDPFPFCVSQTDYFLKKYPNFFQFNRDSLLPETMLAFSEGLNKFDEEKNPNVIAFLRKIIEYRLLTYIKNQYKTFELNNKIEHYPEVQSYAPIMESKIDMQLIMDQLDGRQKEVYYYYFMKDFDVLDIAEKLNLSRTRIDQILADVKKKVKKILDGDGKFRAKAHKTKV